MNPPLFSDCRAVGLLDRVRDDVHHLRDDLGNLLTHAKRETLPNGVRDLADQAKHQFAVGSAYAASRLRSLRVHPPQPSLGWVSGAVVAGLVAYGVYALCHNGHNGCDERGAEDEDG